MPLVDQFGKPVAQDANYRRGQRISKIFHPTVNGILSFLVVATLGQSGSWLYGLTWAFICIAVFVTPPTIYFNIRLRRGDFSDDDVSHRTERNQLYVVALVSIAVGTVLLVALGLPTVFLQLVAAGVGIIGSCALINLVWKISVHSSSVATLATLLTLFGRGYGASFWLVVALVGWARMRTGNHTLWQVIAGWCVAIVGVVLAFRWGG